MSVKDDALRQLSDLDLELRETVLSLAIAQKISDNSPAQARASMLAATVRKTKTTAVSNDKEVSELKGLRQIFLAKNGATK